MIAFRSATVTDIEAIAALHAQSWKETYPGILPADFLANEVDAERLAVWQERFLDSPSNREVIVADDDGKIAGFACVFTNEDPIYGALLDNLHVGKAWKGQGLGKQLIGRAARWAQQQDPATPFYLWVYEKNQGARAFYDNLGATNQEAIQGEHAVAVRYTWPDTQSLIDRTSLPSAASQ